MTMNSICYITLKLIISHNDSIEIMEFNSFINHYLMS